MEEGDVAVGHPAWSGVQGGAGVSLPMPLSGPCIIFCLVLCSTFASPALLLFFEECSIHCSWPH